MYSSKNLKCFFLYLGIFFIVVIIGTLAHELGHYIVAVIYGVPAQISYGHTHYFGSLTADQRFWFLMGGPISTWLVSTMGVIVILCKYRHMHNEKDLHIGIGQSISTVATSFSLRFIFNTGLYFINRSLLDIPSVTDETLIAGYLGINPDFLMYGSALVGLIFIVIAFYYLPHFQRYIIFIDTIIGGILGYFFWFYWIGPIILPRP